MNYSSELRVYRVPSVRQLDILKTVSSWRAEGIHTTEKAWMEGGRALFIQREHPAKTGTQAGGTGWKYAGDDGDGTWSCTGGASGFGGKAHVYAIKGRDQKKTCLPYPMTSCS